MADAGSAGAGRPYKAYVIFHGLWAFESRKDRILAHTPFIAEHRVCAGYFEDVGGVPADRTVSLSPCHCRVTGVTPGKKTKFEGGKNVVVPDADFLSKFADRRFARIDLGTVKDVRSVRNVKVEPPPVNPFAGEDGEKLRPANVSMVQVFIYDIEDPTTLGLTSSKAKPHIDPVKRIAKLHVYAEPDTMGHRFHALVSYARLAEMFGLEILPIAPLFTPASDENIEGLDIRDMKTLLEMGKMHAIGAVSKDENCDALVIDNSTKEGPLEEDSMEDGHH